MMPDKKPDNVESIMREIRDLWSLKECSDEEKVIRLIKGDFEKYCGLSFDDFIKTHDHLLKNNPEKLI